MLRRGLDIALILAMLAIAIGALSGRSVVSIGPIRIGLGTFYNGMLAVIVLVGWRAWLATRPVWRLDADVADFRRLSSLAVLAAAVCLLCLSPVLVGVMARSWEGTLPEVPTYWRSSPRGVDLLAYFVPNPEHPWFGQWTHTWMLPTVGDAFPEFVAAFPLTAWLLIAYAVWRRELPRMWMAFTALFMALSLGPFAHVAGFNTQTAAPWALLRYLPVIGLARSPSRFSIVAALGLSLLVAYWMEARLRASGGRLRWTAWPVACVLAFELWPAPRTLYSAEVPDVYRMIAASDGEEGRVLELPTGIRDGTSSIGNFNASAQFFQTRHNRPLIGGYLSRVSETRKQEGRRAPVLRLLFALSEGKEPESAEQVTEARSGRERFLARSCVRYVVVDKRRASPELRRVAVDVLALQPMHEDEDYELLVPVAPPACLPRSPRGGWTISAVLHPNSEEAGADALPPALTP